VDQLLAQIASVADSDPTLRPDAAHWYDDKGRSEKIAAVLPTHNGGVSAY
jgi:hypothetical protein